MRELSFLLQSHACLFLGAGVEFWCNRFGWCKRLGKSNICHFFVATDKRIKAIKIRKYHISFCKIAEEEGYKPIVLWSINNERKMSEEQLKVREYILNTGNIPEPYNLLIINGAMQEGWNLFDNKVNWAILDTLDITEQIQALGRIRKDIDLVIKRTKDEKQVTFKIDLPDYYLNKELTQEDKDILCEELRILDVNGRLRKWPTIKKYLKDSGYIIKDSTLTINGTRTRVSVISVKE